MVRGSHLTMPRRWLCPVTWISLLAFSLGNMPGPLVGATHLLAAGPRHSRACQAASCRCCCPECLPDSDCSTGESSFSCSATLPSERTFAAQGLAMASDEGNCAPCHSCPCSSGACPHCNTTNVPYYAAGVLFGIPAPCLGQHLAETPLLFPPAYCGKIIRPPIA
jgi:hypothetical protein